MKTRPMFPASFTSTRGAAFALAHLQCCRSMYVCTQRAALSTSTQWQAGRWIASAQGTRYASTSTSTSTTSSASKHRQSIPQPSSAKHKATKPSSVPAKSLKPAAPAKLHTASAPTPTTALEHARDKLNPPPFSYPPALSVPERKPDQNYVSYLFSCGKAYLSFYKTGISHTRQTLKLAKAIRARLASQGKGISAPIAGAGILTRSEWQLLRRSRRDMLRLPVMGFLILALGEWLPLVVIYLTPVIPEPCRIPVQIERVLRRKEAARKERLSRIATHALRLQSQDRTPATDADAVRLAAAAEGLLDPASKVGRQGGLAMAKAIVPPEAGAALSLFHLLLLSARLDCHPRVLDWAYVTPPKWLLQRNVSKTLAYLTQDDELIRRDGGSQRLDKGELQRACVERGIDVLGKSEAEQRKALAQWYDM